MAVMTEWEILDVECDGAEWQAFRESSAMKAASHWVMLDNARACEYPPCRRVAVRKVGDTGQGMQFDVELQMTPSYHVRGVL